MSALILACALAIPAAGLLFVSATFLRAGFFRVLCKHEWERDGARRCCVHCGSEQWLFSKRFPEAGEPAHEWREMGRPQQRGEEP